MTKKVSFHTLGCKLNFSETSTIAADFLARGFEKVKFGEPVDVVVINTCTVTSIADKKCRQAVKKAQKSSPDAFIAITGCYAQLKPKEIAEIPGVDIVLGMNEKFKLFEHIENFRKLKEPQIYSCEIDDVTRFDAAYSSNDRTRSFLKVQDGCDYVCTYCTIPKARGMSRNDTIEKTVEKAREIAEKGFKEIILTGVNIGDFGRSTGESFFDLIRALDKVEGIERYRISSIEPNLLTEEIIRFTADSQKFLPHFHIPLQSGSNKLLKLMKRRYNRELFAVKISKIKEIMPDAFIGIDVIVGFPGESDKDFADTYQFLENSDISFLHVFSYSIRPGTPAAEMNDKISPKIISERSQKLHQLSEQKHKEFYQKHLGTQRKVLFEASNSKGKMYGFTDNYIKVEIPFDKNLRNLTLFFDLTEIAESGNAKGNVLM
jgi:threonylcarbamoyladenosine tRNA methylthiotransferase MtaB